MISTYQEYMSFLQENSILLIQNAILFFRFAFFCGKKS